jgi:uncharacterized membrane protein YbhN (UPF0104 family)
MKKHLSLILRIVIAAAGLVYIAYNVNWYDEVRVPALVAVTGADGPTAYVKNPAVDLAKNTAFRVTAGEVNPVEAAPRMSLTLAGPGRTGPVTLTLTPAQFGAGADQYGYLLRPGLRTTLKHVKLGYLLGGLLLVFPIYPIQAVRWKMLLRSRGMDVTLARSFRLVMVGSFFNYAMPGSTGGDLVKAYYAAARTDRRADAVMSVVVDRIVGLLGLVLVAGLAGLLVVLHARTGSGHADAPGLEQCLRRTYHATGYLWLAVAGVVALSAVYFSRRLRRRLGLEWLLAKLLPQGSIADKVDRAMVGYSERKGTVALTVLMSVPLQFMLAASTALAGFALGMEERRAIFVLLIAVVPILFLVAAVPISYQGFGFMEGAGFYLLLAPGVANANQITVMLLLARLFQVFYSMFGSIFLLGGDIHMHPEHEPSQPAGVSVAS